MSGYPSNIAEVQSQIQSGKQQLGGGAQFWAYISPSNNTAQWVTKWEVVLTQGNWKDSITSDLPHKILKTPDLSGVFDVTVWASGPNFPWQQITPAAGSQPNVGCNDNCAAMVGIVANASGTGANYWTVWDAICN
jgi:hypothetical protein